MNQLQPPGLSEVIQILAAMPGLQLVFLLLAAVTWLGGGNILVAYHYKRVGKSPWAGAPVRPATWLHTMLTATPVRNPVITE